MKLMAKSTKELLQVLDETKETLVKDKKYRYPYTEWEHKRAQVKERLHRLPEYVHQAVEIMNKEEQKMAGILISFPSHRTLCGGRGHFFEGFHSFFAAVFLGEA